MVTALLATAAAFASATHQHALFPSRERPPARCLPGIRSQSVAYACIPCNPEERAMKLSRCRRLLYLSRIVAMIGFAIALAAPTPSDAAEIKVLTTRAMNHVLTELAGAFQRTSEHKIAIILAPPAEIRRRIVNGEIVDVAMSGSGAVEDLVQQGKIAPGDRLILARVGVGVAVSAGAAEPGNAPGGALQRRVFAAEMIG